MCGPIDASIRQRIDAEFTLPSLERLAHRYETQTAGPGPVLRKLVCVFIDDGTLCPRVPSPARRHAAPGCCLLVRLGHDTESPPNYFTTRMLTPSTDLAGSRPVDLLHDTACLYAALETFANR